MTKGSDFLLKIGNGSSPETFATVGGFRSNGFAINNETVDVVSKDSSGIRALLAGAGVQSFSASGSGVFVDDASFGSVHIAATAKTINDWQIVIPGHGTYEGAFQITSLEFAGEYNGEMTYSLSLESAGTISFY